jgi:hypothetical protein
VRRWPVSIAQLAKLARQLVAAQLRVIGDKLPHKQDLAAANVTSAITILFRHSSSVPEMRTERLLFDD